MPENMDWLLGPGENDPEKKEEVASLHISIGDRIHNADETYDDVTDVVETSDYPGGGYIEFVRVGGEAGQETLLLSFEDLNEHPEKIAHIDKLPQLTEAMKAESKITFRRQRAALEQIKHQLNNPAVDIETKKALREKRLRFMREIATHFFPPAKPDSEQAP